MLSQCGGVTSDGLATMAGSPGASSRMALRAIGGQGHIPKSKGHGSVFTLFTTTKQGLGFCFLKRFLPEEKRTSTHSLLMPHTLLPTRPAQADSFRSSCDLLGLRLRTTNLFLLRTSPAESRSSLPVKWHFLPQRASLLLLLNLFGAKLSYCFICNSSFLCAEA